MAGTKYTYEIMLDGSKGMASAVKFKQDLEKQLGQIKLTTKVDTKDFQAQLTAATQAGAKEAGDGVKLAMQSSVKAFQREASRMGPKTFFEPMQESLKKGIKQPTQEAVNSLNQLRTAMASAHEATAKMGIGVDQWMDASKVDKWGIALQAAQRKIWGVRGFGYQMEARGRGIMMGAGATAGGMAASAKAYLDYSEPLNRAARNMELNAENTAWLDRELRSLAGSVSLFSPKEQAEQLYLWAAATGEVAESQEDIGRTLKNTQEVQKLAALGMISQANAVETTTDIMSQYQLSVDDTEKIVATMVKVAAVSKAEVGDLGLAFRYAGARAEASNTSFEETAATLQILSGFGMRGSMAGRGLARLMENLIAPSAAARKEMDALFESAFGTTAEQKLRTAQGEFVGLGEAINILAEATATLPDAMARQEFVSRITTQNASRVLIPLLEMQLEARKQNIDAIQATENILNGLVGTHEQAYMSMVEDTYGYTVSSKSAVETTQDQWQQFLQSVPGRFKATSSEVQGALTTIGESVLQYALPQIEDLVDKFTSLANVIEENDWVIDFTIRGVKWAAGLGALLIAGGKIITIYADVKAIAMAAAMRDAANKQVAAATEMLAAARLQVGGGAAGATGIARTAGGALLPSAAAAGGAGAPGAISSVTTGLVALGIALPVLVAGILALDKKIRMQLQQAEEIDDVFKAYTLEQRMAIIYGPQGPNKTMSGPAGEQSPFIYDRGQKRIEWRGLNIEATEEDVDRYLENLGLTAQTFLEQVGDSIQLAQTSAETMIEQSATDRQAALELAATTTTRAEAELMDRIPGVQVDFFERSALGMDQLVAKMREATGPGHALEDIFRAIDGYLGDAVDALGRVASIASAGGVLTDIPTAEQLGSQLQGGILSGWQEIRGLGDVLSPAQVREWGMEYTSELAQVYMRNRHAEQWQLDLAVDAFKRSWDERIQKTRDSVTEMGRAQEEYQKNVERAQGQMRSFVGGLLTPTQVTAEDVWETEQGIYDDKWDEYPRRLRAALAGSPDFEKMIPEGLDEQGRARWVQNEIKAFYAGLRPDMVDWDALAADFNEKMQVEQGKERLIDIALTKLGERGISMEREDVAAFFGLTSPAEQAYFGGQTPSQVGESMNTAMQSAMSHVEFAQDDVDIVSSSFAGKFRGGLEIEFGGIGWTTLVTNAWTSDFEDNKSLVEGLGRAFAAPLVTGLQAELESYNFIMLIVSIVMKRIREALD